ncbi:hypothetical protein SCFA_900001 [anaerobic digester metagenome]|uniref:Uncharacterized protein n=1 Tax=anaerobic digester metagenome TaxID=1263854 RepID=A0A485M975_9ZZZZ
MSEGSIPGVFEYLGWFAGLFIPVSECREH